MLLFIAKKSFLQMFLITILLWLFCELIWLMPGLGRWTRNREGTIPNFSSMSLFIGLFSLKIKDESHFKLLYFCFTNTVILASKNLNPMHKLCFSSKPIFQIFIFSLTFSHRPYTGSRHAKLKIVCKKYAQFNAFAYGICKRPLANK